MRLNFSVKIKENLDTFFIFHVLPLYIVLLLLLKWVKVPLGKFSKYFAEVFQMFQSISVRFWTGSLDQMSFSRISSGKGQWKLFLDTCVGGLPSDWFKLSVGVDISEDACEFVFFKVLLSLSDLARSYSSSIIFSAAPIAVVAVCSSMRRLSSSFFTGRATDKRGSLFSGHDGFSNTAILKMKKNVF